MTDSEQAKPRMSWAMPLLLVAAALLIGFTGIHWGLPSMARNRLYFSLGGDVPDVPREIVENSWKHFPEFGWLDENKGPDNLQGQIKRSLFNPVRSYHPDEYVIFKTIGNMHPGKLDFDPKFCAWPSFIIYLIAAALELCSLVGMVHLTTDIKYYFEHPDAMARLYVVGRTVVALFGAASVFLMYKTGAKLRGRRCGLLAAVALLLSPAFVIHVHYMTADIPMMCFAVLTLLFCLNLIQHPSLRVYLAAGAAAGLCTGMKYVGGVVVFTLVYSHIIAWVSGKGTRHRWLLAALVLSAACFCAVNPYHVLHLPKVLKILSWESEYVVQSGARMSWLLIPGRILLCGLGLTIPALALIGLVRFSLTKRLPDIIVASAFVIYLGMARVSSPFLRHYLALVPFVVLLAALLVVDACNRFKSARGRARALVLGGALLIVPCLPTSARALCAFASENVRTEGGQWIAEHIPRDETIAVISEPWQFDCPPMDMQKRKIVVTGYDVAKLKEARPDWFVGTSLQFRTLYGFESPTGDMRKFRDEVLRNDEIARRFSFPGANHRFCARCPQDMRYVCPDIFIYQFLWPASPPGGFLPPGGSVAGEPPGGKKPPGGVDKSHRPGGK